MFQKQIYSQMTSPTDGNGQHWNTMREENIKSNNTPEDNWHTQRLFIKEHQIQKFPEGLPDEKRLWKTNQNEVQ